MLAVTGAGSAIVKALRPLIPNEEIAEHSVEQTSLNADRYLFCAGVLIGKRIFDQQPEETLHTFNVNFNLVVRACDFILSKNGRARICVVGSESGISGSFDAAYAGSKAALHQYVETKRLNAPGQQLVCIAPSIIGDAGMTMRREDIQILEAKRQAHPKRRFLTSLEVARLVHHVLYVDEGYLTGTVIRMNGGGHL